MTSGQTIASTDFLFPGQESVYRGKVRDVYDPGDSLMLHLTGQKFVSASGAGSVARIEVNIRKALEQ